MLNLKKNAKAISNAIKAADAYLDRQVSKKDLSESYEARIIAVLDAHGMGSAKTKEEISKVREAAAEEVKLINANKAANRAVALADWLSKKGFDSLFDNDEVVVTYRQVASRLEVASNIAKDNVGFIAQVVGGTVDHNDYGSMQPDSIIIDKKTIPFGIVNSYLIEVEGDDEIVSAAKAKAMGIWQSWMDATVPSMKKGAVAFRDKYVSEAQLARLSLFSTTKEANDAIAINGGELGRSYLYYARLGEYKMAAWLVESCNRDAEEAAKKLRELQLNGGLESHLTAVACAKEYNSSMQGLLEPVHWGFDEKHLPVAVPERDLMKYIKSAREAAEMEDAESSKSKWSWDFQANFFAHLVDLGSNDEEKEAWYENLASIVGLTDAIINVGLADNSGSDEEIAARYNKMAGYEMKQQIKFAESYPTIKKCRPWSSTRTLEVYAGGAIRQTKSVATAYYLTRGEHFNIFSDEKHLNTIETNLDWAAYCWLTREQQDEWNSFYAHDALKSLIKKAFRADELACMPDGELYCTQAPKFIKPGRDPRKGIDLVLFLTYSTYGDVRGDNLYAKTLQECRDEARVAIDAAKELEVPLDVLSSRKAAIAAMLESKLK